MRPSIAIATMTTCASLLLASCGGDSGTTPDSTGTNSPPKPAVQAGQQHKDNPTAGQDDPTFKQHKDNPS